MVLCIGKYEEFSDRPGRLENATVRLYAPWNQGQPSLSSPSVLLANEHSHLEVPYHL